MTNRRIRALAVAGVALAGPAAPAAAQVIPPSALASSRPTPAPTEPAIFSKDFKNPALARALELSDSACGDRHLPVRVVGRVPGKFPRFDSAVARFFPKADGDLFLKYVAPELKFKAALLRAGNDPAKRQALFVSILGHQRVVFTESISEALKSFAPVWRQLREEKRVMTMPNVQSLMDERGVFRCNGLKPGSYDVVLTVEEPERATGELTRYGPFTVAQVYYVANLVVPKLKHGRRAVVSPTSYSLITRVDPEHPSGNPTPVPHVPLSTPPAQ